MVQISLGIFKISEDEDCAHASPIKHLQCIAAVEKSNGSLETGRSGVCFDSLVHFVVDPYS